MFAGKEGPPEVGSGLPPAPAGANPSRRQTHAWPTRPAPPCPVGRNCVDPRRPWNCGLARVPAPPRSDCRPPGGGGRRRCGGWPARLGRRPRSPAPCARPGPAGTAGPVVARRRCQPVSGDRYARAGPRSLDHCRQRRVPGNQVGNSSSTTPRRWSWACSLRSRAPPAREVSSRGPAGRTRSAQRLLHGLVEGAQLGPVRLLVAAENTSPFDESPPSQVMPVRVPPPEQGQDWPGPGPVPLPVHPARHRALPHLWLHMRPPRTPRLAGIGPARTLPGGCDGRVGRISRR